MGVRGQRLLRLTAAALVFELFSKPRIAPRYFLRVNMPFRVTGRVNLISWGIWVEVSARDYRRIYELWDSPDQSREPPFHAALANDIHDYPPTSGLPGVVQLQNPTTVPLFTLQVARFGVSSHSGNHAKTRSRCMGT